MRGAAPVDHHNGLVAHDPRVVARRERGDLPRRGVELGTVTHAHPQGAGDVVLEVRRLAPRRPGQWPDVLRPAPPGQQREPPDLAAPDRDQVEPAAGELARLGRCLEVHLLVCGAHVVLLVSELVSSTLGSRPGEDLAAIWRARIMTVWAR